jgi:hypothetical protein
MLGYPDGEQSFSRIRRRAAHHCIKKSKYKVELQDHAEVNQRIEDTPRSAQRQREQPTLLLLPT